ncbi:hypothetical protein [Pedobacter foliorum]|uniref:hypothetical protein n=1 Tax=Pedobacter foliorum TaxID=2739058 RepID=UPI0015631CB1|nr:hypothetical protein [Pedobacter foliorum]NRF37754.1 hypothetical protein [Pedobacter foliorum]
MKAKLASFFFWMRNSFVFQKPRFLDLEYVDYVIGSKPFFLISWNIRYAYKVRVKNTKFSSLETHSSAYIAIPVETDVLEVIISNSWRSERQFIKLTRVVISDKIEFNMCLTGDLKKKTEVIMPSPGTNPKTITVKTLNTSIKNLSGTPKIINLKYH